MPSLTTVLLFALATFLLTVSPGPGVLYVTARSISQGRAAGFASMFGIESGELVWIAAAATGVAAVLAASTAALGILRWAGAAYLVYLGVQRWRQAESPPALRRAKPAAIFAQGFVTQVFNPKVAVFFVAFLPQFLNSTQPIVPQVVALGVVYVAIAVAVDTCYVLGASAISSRLASSAKMRRRTSRVAAATYVALGVAAAAGGAEKL